MSILSKLFSLFNKHKDKLPEDMDSVDEIKDKASDLVNEHGDKLDKITDKIPGEMDDKIVDKARETFRK